MSDTIDGFSFYANEYRSNLQMSMYDSDASVDMSLVEGYVSNGTSTEDSGTTVKNSSELLEEIRATKQQAATLSSTLSNYSDLCVQGNCSSDDTTQEGAKVLMKVLAASGGSDAVNSFTDEFSSLSSTQLNTMFNQVGQLSEANATVAEVSEYAASMIDVEEMGSTKTFNGFLDAVDTILSTDYTDESVSREITSSQYKREVMTEFTDAISTIINEEGGSISSSDALDELFATIENATGDSMVDDIQAKISELT